MDCIQMQVDGSGSGGAAGGTSVKEENHPSTSTDAPHSPSLKQLQMEVEAAARLLAKGEDAIMGHHAWETNQFVPINAPTTSAATSGKDEKGECKADDGEHDDSDSDDDADDAGSTTTPPAKASGQVAPSSGSSSSGKGDTTMTDVSTSGSGSGSTTTHRTKKNKLTRVSCHQCKTTKSDGSLLFCTTKAEKGKRKRKCRKKYCDACLRRSYNMSISSLTPEDVANYKCPACQNNCSCAACQRKRLESMVKKEQTRQAAANGAAAYQSLARAAAAANGGFLPQGFNPMFASLLASLSLPANSSALGELASNPLAALSALQQSLAMGLSGAASTGQEVDATTAAMTSEAIQKAVEAANAAINNATETSTSNQNGEGDKTDTNDKMATTDSSNADSATAQPTPSKVETAPSTLNDSPSSTSASSSSSSSSSSGSNASPNSLSSPASTTASIRHALEQLAASPNNTIVTSNATPPAPAASPSATSPAHANSSESQQVANSNSNGTAVNDHASDSESARKQALVEQKTRELQDIIQHLLTQDPTCLQRLCEGGNPLANLLSNWTNNSSNNAAMPPSSNAHSDSNAVAAQQAAPSSSSSSSSVMDPSNDLEVRSHTQSPTPTRSKRRSSESSISATGNSNSHVAPSGTTTLAINGWVDAPDLMITEHTEENAHASETRRQQRARLQAEKQRRTQEKMQQRQSERMSHAPYSDPSRTRSIPNDVLDCSTKPPPVQKPHRSDRTPSPMSAIVTATVLSKPRSARASSTGSKVIKSPTHSSRAIKRRTHLPSPYQRPAGALPTRRLSASIEPSSCSSSTHSSPALTSSHSSAPSSSRTSPASRRIPPRPPSLLNLNDMGSTMHDDLEEDDDMMMDDAPTLAATVVPASTVEGRTTARPGPVQTSKGLMSPSDPNYHLFLLKRQQQQQQLQQQSQQTQQPPSKRSKAGSRSSSRKSRSSRYSQQNSHDMPIHHAQPVRMHRSVSERVDQWNAHVPPHTHPDHHRRHSQPAHLQPYAHHQPIYHARPVHVTHSHSYHLASTSDFYSPPPPSLHPYPAHDYPQEFTYDSHHDQHHQRTNSMECADFPSLDVARANQSTTAPQQQQQQQLFPPTPTPNPSHGQSAGGFGLFSPRDTSTGLFSPPPPYENQRTYSHSRQQPSNLSSSVSGNPFFSPLPPHGSAPGTGSSTSNTVMNFPSSSSSSHPTSHLSAGVHTPPSANVFSLGSPAPSDVHVGGRGVSAAACAAGQSGGFTPLPPVPPIMPPRPVRAAGHHGMQALGTPGANGSPQLASHAQVSAAAVATAASFLFTPVAPHTPAMYNAHTQQNNNNAAHTSASNNVSNNMNGANNRPNPTSSAPYDWSQAQPSNVGTPATTSTSNNATSSSSASTSTASNMRFYLPLQGSPNTSFSSGLMSPQSSFGMGNGTGSGRCISGFGVLMSPMDATPLQSRQYSLGSNDPSSSLLMSPGVNESIPS